GRPDRVHHGEKAGEASVDRNEEDSLSVRAQRLGVVGQRRCVDAKVAEEGGVPERHGSCLDGTADSPSRDGSEFGGPFRDASQFGRPSRDGSEFAGPSRDGSEFAGPSRDGSEFPTPSRDGTKIA